MNVKQLSERMWSMAAAEAESDDKDLIKSRYDATRKMLMNALEAIDADPEGVLGGNVTVAVRQGDGILTVGGTVGSATAIKATELTFRDGATEALLRAEAQGVQAQMILARAATVGINIAQMASDNCDCDNCIARRKAEELVEPTMQ